MTSIASHRCDCSQCHSVKYLSGTEQIPTDYVNTPQFKQESSAKLTNQRVSYAFTSSPFSFHAPHILPTSRFQYSYSCIYLFTTDISQKHVHVLEL